MEGSGIIATRKTIHSSPCGDILRPSIWLNGAGRGVAFEWYAVAAKTVALPAVVVAELVAVHRVLFNHVVVIAAPGEPGGDVDEEESDLKLLHQHPYQQPYELLEYQQHHHQQLIL